MSACPRTIEYRLFGGFRLIRKGAPVAPAAWERPMAARLARFLLVHRESVPEDQLLEAFWRDHDPVAARRCLVVSVSRCRAVLGSAALICNDRSYELALHPGDCLDVDDFERASALALARPAGRERLTALEDAAELWTGEPLPEDRYADWTRAWRESLEDLHREVLVALGDAHAEAGEHGAALRIARRMLELDPLDEGAHRRVMAAYAALGRRNRAFEQYMRCRRALVDALGVEPAHETAALHARILAGEDMLLAA
ncbi:MAG TPA: BTAD domain-containing putative transcriptional regulator [Thermoleophilaceae bacterium]